MQNFWNILTLFVIKIYIIDIILYRCKEWLKGERKSSALNFNSFFPLILCFLLLHFCKFLSGEWGLRHMNSSPLLLIMLFWIARALHTEFIKKTSGSAHLYDPKNLGYSRLGRCISPWKLFTSVFSNLRLCFPRRRHHNHQRREAG